MRLILITGGARSGKSAYALQRGLELGGDVVTFVATAKASDEEMQRRIARHKAERPAAWRTVEAALCAGDAIRAANTSVVILDCVTLLAANVLLAAHPAGEEDAISAIATAADDILAAVAARVGVLIAVTNEVGLGIVPEGNLARWFRDGLGLVNQRLAAKAETVVLMVSGLALTVKSGVHKP